MNYFYFYSHEIFNVKYFLHHQRGSENVVHHDISNLIVKGSTQNSSTIIEEHLQHK